MGHWTEDKVYITVRENPGETSSSLQLLSFPQTAIYSYFLLKAVPQNGGIKVTEEFGVAASSLRLWLYYPSSMNVTYSKRIGELAERLQPCLVHHACSLDHAHDPAPCISHAHERLGTRLYSYVIVKEWLEQLKPYTCRMSDLMLLLYIQRPTLVKIYTSPGGSL